MTRTKHSGATHWPPGEERAEIDQLKSHILRDLRGPIDLSGLISRELAPLDFVLGPLGLLKDVTGVLAAAGGTGKGFYMLGLAASIACEDADIPFFFDPRLPAPVKRGRVVLLFGEDPEVVLEMRLKALLQSIRARYGDKAVRSIEANLKTESLHGQSPCLVAKGGDDNTPLCHAWQEIVAEKIADARLFALDTVSCFHRADENDNGEMTVLLQVANRLATATRGSGLLVHHVPKNATPEQVRGASAITNSARWACNLVQDNKDRERVAVRQWKENYMAALDTFTLARGTDGILYAPLRTKRESPATIPATTTSSTRQRRTIND